jgi:hypothetical protein
VGSEESWNNNDIVVCYQPTPGSDGYPITALQHDTFETSHLDNHQEEVRLTWPLDSSESRYSVNHFYAVWQVEYASLNSAFLSVLFRVNYLRLLMQRRFDRSLRAHRDRHELIRVLLDHWQPEFRSTIRVDRVLETLYGPPIRTSRRNYDYHRRLTLMLQSLAASGEVSLNNSELPSEITLLPQALKTAADFETESRRHRDSLRITRLQLCVAIAMLLVAVATLYTRCTGADLVP